jgi:hypothetical protein
MAAVLCAFCLCLSRIGGKHISISKKLEEKLTLEPLESVAEVKQLTGGALELEF